MMATVLGFVLLGLAFGLLSASRRHWFSEGVTRPDADDPRGERRERALWVLLCSLLWPLMLLTGLHSWWLMSRRARSARLAIGRAPDGRR
jgi:hypothetical protein